MKIKCFYDAGLNPATLRGTKTGVYIGVSGSEAGEAFSRDPEELLGYSMTGCQRAMLANRISYFFDFSGRHSIQQTQFFACKFDAGLIISRHLVKNAYFI